MSDLAHRVFAGAMRLSAWPASEAARVAFATSRMRVLEHRERRLLELAVQAPDDHRASWLELRADTAWRDAQAVAGEHALDPASWEEEEAP